MRQPRSSLLKILLSSLILMLMVGDVAAQRGMGGGFRNNFYSNQQVWRQNQPYNYSAQRQQQALQARQQRDYAIQKQATMRQQRQVMEQRRQDMQRVMQQRKEQATLQRKMIVDRQQQAQGSKNALLSQQKTKGQQIAVPFVLKEQRQIKNRQDRLYRIKQANKKKQHNENKKIEAQNLISITTLTKKFQESNAENKNFPNKSPATQSLKVQRSASQALAKKTKAMKVKLFTTAKNKEKHTGALTPTKQKASENFGSCSIHGCTCSFNGDTLVLTRDGFEPIRGLVAGEDYVWSRDEYTGDMDWQPVIAHYSNNYDETVEVTIVNKAGDSQTIISNRIHPFYVLYEIDDIFYEEKNVKNKFGKWVDAQSLRIGDLLLSSNGEGELYVSNVSIVKESFVAYNLTVANFHTYFVKGNDSNRILPVWVHNDCPTKNVNISEKQLDRKFKHAADFGVRDVRKNRETINQFKAAISNHLNSQDTVEKGTYLYVKNSTVFFNKDTLNVVVLDKYSNFVTGFKLRSESAQFKRYTKEGLLR